MANGGGKASAWRFVHALACGALLAAGCASPLPGARRSFYGGDVARAAERLEHARVPERDRVLLLMERGLIRQTLGAYEDSTRDFIAASDLIEEMETRSVAHGVAGTVTDDRALRYRGASFERNLLHAFTAHNHLATGAWDLVAVEARRILRVLDAESRRDVPEDAYSRYMAGFGFELMDDPSNAALQFRHAARLVEAVQLDETGRFEGAPGDGDELVVFVLMGRSPSGMDVQYRWPRAAAPVSVELLAGDRILGSTHVLADTWKLAIEEAEREATRRTTRAVARIAAKETAARAIDRENGLLGFLFRVVLIDFLEQPDTRRWETLPRWLMVGRVPCPPDLETFNLVVRAATGETQEIEIAGPFPRRRQMRVAVVRVGP